MGILNRIAEFMVSEPRAQRAMLDQRAANVGGLFTPKWEVSKPAWLPNTMESNDQQGFRRVPLIFRCVKFVADSASSAPLRVYETTDNQQTEVPEHPFRVLMKRPNPGMGEARFLSFCVMVMQISGFVLIEKERDRLGNVIALWPLRSDWARPIPRGAAPPDWEYRIPGRDKPFILSSDDVIPITYQDTPDYRPTGIGPLEVALREVGIMNTLTDFIKAFFDRGAMPMYWAIPNDDPRSAAIWNDPATVETFREKFQQRFGGLNNATEIGIAGGIKDIKPLGFSLDELAYPELRKLNEVQICAVFGVSPILIDAQVGLGTSTYNNKSESRKSFFEDFMTFLWSRVDDAFTRHLLPEFGDTTNLDIQFDVSDIPALKEDRNGQWQRAMQALQSGGITLNDYRREIGMSEIVKGGDVFLIPSGVTPVAMDALVEFAKPKEVPAPLDPNKDTTDTTTDTVDDPAADEQKSRQKRYVPPLPDEVVISKSDVDRAIASFDEQFPDFKGLLSATVEDGE